VERIISCTPLTAFTSWPLQPFNESLLLMNNVYRVASLSVHSLSGHCDDYCQTWSFDFRVTPTTFIIDLIFCYTIVFGLVSVNLDDFFTFSTVTNTRGHKYKLYKSHFVTLVDTFSQSV